MPSSLPIKKETLWGCDLSHQIDKSFPRVRLSLLLSKVMYVRIPLLSQSMVVWFVNWDVIHRYAQRCYSEILCSISCIKFGMKLSGQIMSKENVYWLSRNLYDLFVVFGLRCRDYCDIRHQRDRRQRDRTWKNPNEQINYFHLFYTLHCNEVSNSNGKHFSEFAFNWSQSDCGGWHWEYVEIVTKVQFQSKFTTVIACQDFTHIWTLNMVFWCMTLRLIISSTSLPPQESSLDCIALYILGLTLDTSEGWN